MIRNRLIFFITLILFLGSVVLTVDAIQQRDYQLRGYVDPTEDSNLPFRVPRLGVNADLTQYDAAKLEQNLNLMEEAHIVWVRQNIRWSDIEPEHGKLNWSTVDRIFAAFATHPQLKPIVVLTSEPEWAKSDTPTPTSPPMNIDAFAKFAGAFAARYSSQVDYYQVWDEPNLIAAWGQQEPNPTAYTAVLAEVYKVIHANDSIATVIAAALAPTIETGPKNITDILFLRAMYAAGAKDYMDALAAKPYGFSVSPDDRTVSANKLNFSHIIALREEMVRSGDAKKAIWASEWGWNSLPDNWQGKPSIWGSVSSHQQVEYTFEALNRVEREWPWLAGMLLSHWQPVADSQDPLWGFALVDQNNRSSALLSSLSSNKSIPIAQNGLYAAVNPFARYSGVWTFGSLGADIGWVQDSQFAFDFAGTDIALLLRQDNYTAYLYPSIEGNQANSTPSDASGNHYIVLTSPSLLPEVNLVSVAKNLPESSHTLRVIADRGWDRWAIAGFAVSSGSLSTPFANRIAVGVITSLLTALSVLMSARPLKRGFVGVMAQRLTIYFGASVQFIISVLSSIVLLIGMLLTWGDGTTNIFRHEPLSLLLAIATSGLLKLQPGIVMTVLASLVLLAIFYNYPHIGLALMIFWSPFFLFPVELYRFAFPLAEIMIILTSTAWLLRLVNNNARLRQVSVSQFPITPLKSWWLSLSMIDYLVVAWALIGIVSVLWTERRAPAITELRVIFIEPLLFYVIYRTCKLTKGQLLLIVNAFILAGLLVALIGLFQYFQGEAVITAEAGARRLASVYGSPNNVALFLGRCIPFLLAFGILQPNKYWRVVYLVALAPIGIALLLTQSVGGIFIGVPISVIVVLWLSLGRRGRYLVIGFVIVLLIGFVFSLQSERFARVLDFSSGTNFYRVRAWLSAINIIHDHPFTGLGLDQFLYEFRGKYILPDAWQEPNLSHPHNILLDFWVRLGFIGALLLVVIQIAFWRTAEKRLQALRGKSPEFYAILIGTVGSMVNLLGHGLIDNSVFVQDLSYIFILLLALVQIDERAIY